jgi:hypothetical protein
MYNPASPQLLIRSTFQTSAFQHSDRSGSFPLIRELRRFTPSSKDRLYIYTFFFGNKTSLTFDLQVSTWTLNIGVKLPIIILCGFSFERGSENGAVKTCCLKNLMPNTSLIVGIKGVRWYPRQVFRTLTMRALCDFEPRNLITSSTFQKTNILQYTGLERFICKLVV